MFREHAFAAAGSMTLAAQTAPPSGEALAPAAAAKTPRNPARAAAEEAGKVLAVLNPLSLFAGAARVVGVKLPGGGK
jgi:hypothetical protein